MWHEYFCVCIAHYPVCGMPLSGMFDLQPSPEKKCHKRRLQGFAAFRSRASELSAAAAAAAVAAAATAALTRIRHTKRCSNVRRTVTEACIWLHRNAHGLELRCNDGELATN